MRISLKYAALTAYLMNLFDLHYTLWALERPGVWEWNPFCRAAMRLPYGLEMYKYAAVPLLLWLLYRCRELPLARWGIWAVFLVFSATTLYQVTLLSVLL